PTILWLSQKPKYPQTSVPHGPRMDAYRTIFRPLNTERAMKKIKDNNHLLFIVDNKVNKKPIAEAINKLYDVTPLFVNTFIQPNGKKKAFVRLTP
ncbi:ribosomal protein L23/L15e core domain-containing protein, partial [Phakopsora pachyrhizi]